MNDKKEILAAYRSLDMSFMAFVGCRPLFNKQFVPVIMNIDFPDQQFCRHVLQVKQVKFFERFLARGLTFSIIET